MNGFHLLKVIHTIISMTFMIIAIAIVIRSVRGIKQNKEYTSLDKFLSYAFIVNLYLQLILGLFLFSNMGSSFGYDYLSADGSMKVASKRLWPVEHMVLMLFALFIANLGLIVSIKSSDKKEKHKKVMIYYLISILLIAISLSGIYIF